MILFTLAAGLFFIRSEAAPTKAPLRYLEVSARQGPVSLTLRVLKRSKKPLEPVYFQLELKNIGDRRLVISDPAFTRAAALEETTKTTKFGAYLEARAPNGRPPYYAPGDRESHLQPDVVLPGDTEMPAEPKPLLLPPGQSVRVACIAPLWVEGREWCTLDFWLLVDAGRHRLRAVYDVRPRGGDPILDPDDVRVETPWIPFEVKP